MDKNYDQLYELDYFDLKETKHIKLTRNHLEYTGYEGIKHFMNLQSKNIGRGMYISVEEIHTFEDGTPH